MPFKSREKLEAWRATPDFKAKNYARVKEWRSRPENKAKRAEEARKWRAKHPDVCKTIKERFRERHAEELRPIEAEQARARRAADPEGQKRRMAAFKARKEAERVALAGRAKPELCEICGGCEIRIVFDHCHAKGHFRGWICDRCNRVLGLVRDDPALLDQLAGYLRRVG